MRKNLALIPCILIVLLFLSGCLDLFFPQVEVSGVSLDIESLTLTGIGTSGMLTAEIEPENADDRKAMWLSGNPDVATVEDGIVVAHGLGMTTIFAVAGDYSASCTVRVYGIDLNERTVTLTGVGSTATLKAHYNFPDNEEYPVHWSTSEEGIVEVSSDGNIGAVAWGDAVITAEANGTSVPCGVTVVPSVTTFAGNILGLFGNDDGIGTAASFDVPCGITTHGNSLYVADTQYGLIRKIDIATADVMTFVGTGTRGNTDGVGTEASLCWPNDVCTDGTNLFVVDMCGHRIRKIVISSREMTTIAGSGESESTDGLGVAAGFHQPFGICTDGTNLYVTDFESCLVRKVVVSTGEVTTLAGNGMLGKSDGIGTGASFNRPMGICTDGTNLYIADSDNSRIRKIVIATGEVSTFAGTGTRGLVDGPGTKARFNSPYDICIDGTNLYVADYGNYSIRKIVIATGDVTTLGARGEYEFTDGRATWGGPWHPQSLVLVGKKLYVTDSLINRIWMME